MTATTAQDAPATTAGAPTGDTAPVAAKRRHRVGPQLSGFCARYSQPGSHAHCKGATRNGDGSVYHCECETCEHAPQCLECGSSEQVDERNWRCLDLDACRATQAARTAANPVVQALRAATESARERLGLDPADEAPIGRRGARVGRPAAVGRACACGCGGMTKGGEFCMGHDARLRGVLQRTALRRVEATDEDQTWARAELLARGGAWEKAAQSSDSHRALELIGSRDHATFIAAAVERRLNPAAVSG